MYFRIKNILRNNYNHTPKYINIALKFLSSNIESII